MTGVWTWTQANQPSPLAWIALGLAVVLVLTSGTVRGTAAKFNGRTTNGSNVFATTALYAPASLTATPAGLLDRLVPPSPPNPRAERGRDWLAAHGLPTTRDEAWRYTPVDDIVGALEAAAPAPASTSEVSPSVVDIATPRTRFSPRC